MTTQNESAVRSRFPSKTTIVLEPLLGLKPGERAVVMCADAESAERIERHHLVAMARENGVVVETMTPENFGRRVVETFEPDDRIRSMNVEPSDFRGAAKTGTTLRNGLGVWIVDEDTSIPPGVFETVMPSFSGSFIALPRRDGSVVFRGPYAREEDAPELPIWRRNDPGASSYRP